MRGLVGPGGFTALAAGCRGGGGGGETFFAGVANTCCLGGEMFFRGTALSGRGGENLLEPLESLSCCATGGLNSTMADISEMLCSTGFHITLRRRRARRR